MDIFGKEASGILSIVEFSQNLGRKTVVMTDMQSGFATAFPVPDYYSAPGYHERSTAIAESLALVFLHQCQAYRMASTLVKQAEENDTSPLNHVLGPEKK